MKLFQQIDGTVEGVDSRGRGLITAGGKNVSVPFAVPGDRLLVELVKRCRGELHGRLVEVKTPAADRVAPPCPHAAECGGCPWQMMNYPAQLEWKKTLVNTAFASAGLDLRLQAVEASPEIFHHRNRMDYVVAEPGFGTRDSELGKAFALGLKSPGRWWDVLDLRTCLMLSEDAVRVMFQVRDWIKRWKLPVWNLKTHSGLVRYCVIREGKFTGERMITIVTGPESIPADADANLRVRLSGLCTSLFLGINPEMTDLSLSRELRLIQGKDTLNERINGLDYSLRPNSFFQTNSYAAERLQETVLEFARPARDENVLDLYCGVGFFSLPLAKQAQRVIGVELDAEAISLAETNAGTNGIDNAEFHAADTADFLSRFHRLYYETKGLEIIIVDPPRSGLHPHVLQALLTLAPRRIVYVSCNYQALIRELPAFLKLYQVSDLRGLDMFPQTPHVELALVMIKR